MKFTLATSLLTMGSSALASCTFGTYDCLPDKSGIRICNVQSEWEVVGPCPDGSSCEFLPQNGFELPFCTKKATKPARRTSLPDPGSCREPGKYQCDGGFAIQVCSTEHRWTRVGSCPRGSYCGYLNEIPYCLDF